MDYDGLVESQFLNLKVTIPARTELFLKNHYGDDFMTPIKGKKGSSKKTLTEIPIEKETASIVPLDVFFNNLKR